MLTHFLRLFDLTSQNLNPVINYEGISKNIMTVGFQEDGKWMYTGGEDCSARIWDLKMRNVNCQKVYQANSAVNCVSLHPNQQVSQSYLLSFSLSLAPCLSFRNFSSETSQESFISGTCRQTSRSNSYRSPIYQYKVSL